MTYFDQNTQWIESVHLRCEEMCWRRDTGSARSKISAPEIAVRAEILSNYTFGWRVSAVLRGECVCAANYFWWRRKFPAHFGQKSSAFVLYCIQQNAPSIFFVSTVATKWASICLEDMWRRWARSRVLAICSKVVWGLTVVGNAIGECLMPIKSQFRFQDGCLRCRWIPDAALVTGSLPLTWTKTMPSLSLTISQLILEIPEDRRWFVHQSGEVNES